MIRQFRRNVSLTICVISLFALLTACGDSDAPDIPLDPIQDTRAQVVALLKNVGSGVDKMSGHVGLEQWISWITETSGPFTLDIAATLSGPDFESDVGTWLQETLLLPSYQVSADASRAVYLIPIAGLICDGPSCNADWADAQLRITLVKTNSALTIRASVGSSGKLAIGAPDVVVAELPNAGGASLTINLNNAKAVLTDLGNFVPGVDAAALPTTLSGEVTVNWENPTATSCGASLSTNDVSVQGNFGGESLVVVNVADSTVSAQLANGTLSVSSTGGAATVELSAASIWSDIVDTAKRLSFNATSGPTSLSIDAAGAVAISDVELSMTMDLDTARVFDLKVDDANGSPFSLTTAALAGDPEVTISPAFQGRLTFDVAPLTSAGAGVSGIVTDADDVTFDLQGSGSDPALKFHKNEDGFIEIVHGTLSLTSAMFSASVNVPQGQCLGMAGIIGQPAHMIEAVEALTCPQ